VKDWNADKSDVNNEIYADLLNDSRLSAIKNQFDQRSFFYLLTSIETRMINNGVMGKMWPSAFVY